MGCVRWENDFSFWIYVLMGLLRGERGGHEGSVRSDRPGNGRPRNLSDMFFFLKFQLFELIVRSDVRWDVV